MWRMYCVCLLSVIVVLDLLGQSHVNRNYSAMKARTRRVCCGEGEVVTLAISSSSASMRQDCNDASPTER